MTKRIEMDDRFYRMRRGKLVEIPPAWVGKVQSQKHIRQRPSKLAPKVARIVKDLTGVNRYKDRKESLGALDQMV